MNIANSTFFQILSTVDSTNNYAMEQIHAGMATHGMAWFAREQLAGKGQRGKEWISEKDKNIILSIAIEPFGLSAGQQFFLSASAALGCYDFFSKYGGNESSIKWPNDLYWGDRKAGGILIENIFKGNKWDWAVIGVGINLNQEQFDENINAVSLKQITNHIYDVAEMGKELYNFLMNRLEELKKINFTRIVNEYNQYLFRKNKKITLKKDTAKFKTTIKEVNEYGQLITEDKIERIFNWGEVEWVLYENVKRET